MLVWLSPRIFTSCTKPILFLCQCKGSHVTTYFEWYPSLYWLKMCWQECTNLWCSLLVHVGLHINFPILNIIPMSTFGDCVGILRVCLYFASNFFRYSSWLILCYRCNLLLSMRVCPFWLRPLSVPMDLHNFASCVMFIQSDVLNA